MKDAEAGQLSLITKHGKLAIPFDKLLVNYGVHRSMALHLMSPALVSEVARRAGESGA